VGLVIETVQVAATCFNQQRLVFRAAWLREGCGHKVTDTDKFDNILANNPDLRQAKGNDGGFD